MNKRTETRLDNRRVSDGVSVVLMVLITGLLLPLVLSAGMRDTSGIVEANPLQARKKLNSLRADDSITARHRRLLNTNFFFGRSDDLDFANHDSRTDTDPDVEVFNQLSEDYQIFTPEKLQEFLARLASKLRAEKVAEATDLATFADLRFAVLQYWRINHCDEVLDAFRTFVREGRLELDLHMLAGLRDAFNVQKFKQYLHDRRDVERGLPPEQTYKEYMEAIRHTPGAKYPNAFPLLTPHQMMDHARQFLVKVNSSRTPGGAVVVPISDKPAVRIGIIFHCMQYKGRNGGIGPPQYQKYKQAAAQRLINYTNLIYGGSDISFYLKEWRHDTERYPYLLARSVKEWTTCRMGEVKAIDCYVGLVPRYGGDISRYINVFVGVSTVFNDVFPCELCKLAGMTSHIPWSPTSEEDPDQWIWMNFDQYNPDDRNNPWAYEDGPKTLAHELGHYLGLYHTFQSEIKGCSSLNDLVADTAGSIRMGKEETLRLWKLCMAVDAGAVVDPRHLWQYDSCKESPINQPDHVFNLMCYSPAPCTMSLTPGQIERLHVTLRNFRPKLYRNSLVH